MQRWCPVVQHSNCKSTKKTFVHLVYSAQGKVYHGMNSLKSSHTIGSVVTLDPSSYPHPLIMVIMQMLIVCRSGIGRVKLVRPDLNWSLMCRDEYPYYVGEGKSSLSRCRSCGYQFPKSELRIRTTLLRKMPTSIRPCQINLCMQMSCIMNSSKTWKKNNTAWVRD